MTTPEFCEFFQQKTGKPIDRTSVRAWISRGILPATSVPYRPYARRWRYEITLDDALTFIQPYLEEQKEGTHVTK